MQSVLMLISGGPGSERATQALRLALTMRAAGDDIGVFLLQDATLCAAKGGATQAQRLLQELTAGGAGLYCLEEDLTMRGLGTDDLLSGISPAGYARLVELMAGEAGRVMGVF